MSALLIISGVLVFFALCSVILTLISGPDPREINERSEMTRARQAVGRMLRTFVGRPITYVVLIWIGIFCAVPLLFTDPAVVKKHSGLLTSTVLTLEGSGVLFLYGLYRLQEHLAFKFTNLTTISNASPGRAEISGEAQPQEATITSPLDGRDCIAYSVTVEQERIDSLDRQRGWWALFSDYETTDFVVDDDTGTAFVSSEIEPTFRSELDLTERYDDIDDLPDFLQKHLRGSVDVREDGEFYVTGRHIDPGETIYVFGELHAADQDHETDFIMRPDSYTERLVVSDRSEDAVTIIGRTIPMLSMVVSLTVAPVLYHAYLLTLNLL